MSDIFRKIQALYTSRMDGLQKDSIVPALAYFFYKNNKETWFKREKLDELDEESRKKSLQTFLKHFANDDKLNEEISNAERTLENYTMEVFDERCKENKEEIFMAAAGGIAKDIILEVKKQSSFSKGVWASLFATFIWVALGIFFVFINTWDTVPDGEKTKMVQEIKRSVLSSSKETSEKSK